jgi:transcriptional regulator with XRE-family HTH domain
VYSIYVKMDTVDQKMNDNTKEAPKYFPYNSGETQGQRLRRIRDEKGLRQGFIADKANITQAHLSRIENDESGVTRNTLRKIAEAMSVPFEELYVPKDERDNHLPQVIDIDDVLESESAMIRFMGGERVDPQTMEWVRRSLAVIRNEIKRRRDY